MTPSEEIRRALERLNEKNPDCYLAITPRKADGYIINDKLIALFRQAREAFYVGGEELCGTCGNPLDDHMNNCALLALVRAINGNEQGTGEGG